MIVQVKSRIEQVTKVCAKHYDEENIEDQKVPSQQGVRSVG